MYTNDRQFKVAAERHRTLAPIARRAILQCFTAFSIVIVSCNRIRCKKGYRQCAKYLVYTVEM